MCEPKPNTHLYSDIAAQSSVLYMETASFCICRYNIAPFRFHQFLSVVTAAVAVATAQRHTVINPFISFMPPQTLLSPSLSFALRVAQCGCCSSHRSSNDAAHRVLACCTNTRTVSHVHCGRIWLIEDRQQQEKLRESHADAVTLSWRICVGNNDLRTALECHQMRSRGNYNLIVSARHFHLAFVAVSNKNPNILQRGECDITS